MGCNNIVVTNFLISKSGGAFAICRSEAISEHNASTACIAKKTSLASRAQVLGKAATKCWSASVPLVEAAIVVMSRFVSVSFNSRKKSGTSLVRRPC